MGKRQIAESMVKSVGTVLSLLILLSGCTGSDPVGSASPVADAGEDKIAEVGEPVTLDGANSSDPDGDELTYEWTQDPNNPEGVIISYNAREDPDKTPRRVFIATVDGEYVFYLRVSDGSRVSEDKVTVTVIGEAVAPPGMARIPPGEFVMGDDGSKFEDEKPAHTVFLDAYFIDLFEVTNKEIEESGLGIPVRSLTEPIFKGDDRPAFPISWENAKRYCESVGKRLPTEAEWEKAARGTDRRLWPWGNDYNASRRGPDGSATTIHANGAGQEDGFEFTAPVGSFPTGASPYGVQDMAGNVEEWVEDWYDSDYYEVSPRENPRGPAGPTPEGLVIRGGAYTDADIPERVRTSFRNFAFTGGGRTRPTVGFRCAKDAR